MRVAKMFLMVTVASAVILPSIQSGNSEVAHAEAGGFRDRDFTRPGSTSTDRIGTEAEEYRFGMREDGEGKAHAPVQEQIERGRRPALNLEGMHTSGEYSAMGTEDLPAYFLHIPKCAGASFERDAQTTLQRLDRGAFWKHERCYESAHASHPKVEFWFTMLRSPREHVYSQYLECRYDKWGKKKTRDTDFPRNGTQTEDFAHWVEHFNDPSERDNFGCYHPGNMQTRALSCSSWSAHGYSKDLSLSHARSTLKQFSFVGLVELYSVSLCLLRYKVHGVLEENCECGHASAEQKTESHIAHNVPAHDITDVDAETLRAVDEITALDGVLYREAMGTFLAEVRAMEEQTKTTVLCTSDLATFQRKVGYLSEVRDSRGPEAGEEGGAGGGAGAGRGGRR